MKQGSTLFLRAAVLFIGIPILVLCLFLLPQIAIVAFKEAAIGATLGYIVLGILLILYLSAVPFYYALYQTIKLLSYIDKNEAFSELSVRALQRIKKSAMAIIALHVIALPFVYIVAEWDDAPGLIVIGLVVISASMVIAVFTAVLQRLLTEAIEWKLENDLTV